MKIALKILGVIIFTLICIVLIPVYIYGLYYVSFTESWGFCQGNCWDTRYTLTNIPFFSSDCTQSFGNISQLGRDIEANRDALFFTKSPSNCATCADGRDIDISIYGGWFWKSYDLDSMQLEGNTQDVESSRAILDSIVTIVRTCQN